MSYTATYTGSVLGADDTSITLTISTTENGDGSYTVTGISGTFAGAAITGLDGSYNGPDQEAYPQGSPIGGVFDGIDGDGISFDTTNGAVNLELGGGSNLFYVSQSLGDGNVSLTFSSDIPCFLRGTLIETADGPVAVECLAAGMRVRTLRGALVPILWIGHRRYLRDPLAGPTWPAVSPIRIARDAIADGVPARDLLLSPDHSLFLAGHLIPAKALLNGTTIARETGLRDIAYYHVELPAHDVILAENTPAETFLDTGNVGLWHNAGTRPHPPRTTPTPAGAWYAPRALGDHPVLADVRASLAARAARWPEPSRGLAA